MPVMSQARVIPNSCQFLPAYTRLTATFKMTSDLGPTELCKVSINNYRNIPLNVNWS